MTPDDRTHPLLLDRRAALKVLAAGAAGSLLGACAPASAVRPIAATRGRDSWAPVRVSPDAVRRTVVGLRPFRPAGFVVRTEKLDDRVVIHDYGHGGGGVTLSWGCAHLAVREAATTDTTRFAVIGCGVIGLSTAILLQRRGAEVTIYAAAMPPHTTSNIAGAQWSPFSVYEQDAVSPAFRTQFVEASRLAFREFRDRVGRGQGVRWIDNLYLGSREPVLPPDVTAMPELFPDAREIGPGDHPFNARFAAIVSTMFIEPDVYLSALVDEFRTRGGRIVIREFDDIGEILSLNEPVIMNCTGLGSRDLFGDTDLVPVKGQLSILDPQPEVDYLLLWPGLYMFPRSDGILLGGTFQRGEWSLEPDREAEARIIAAHQRRFAPLLANG